MMPDHRTGEPIPSGLGVGEVVALTGGIGGAKLALGLHHALPEGALACVVNTGDDFVHLGLHVSPDIDTILYTLADVGNLELGWGRRNETWTFMDELARLGGETWFRLGDGDLALHVERTRRLAAGETLSAIVDDLRCRLGITSRVMPMTDDPVRTIVTTDAGRLPFQEYFVRLRAEPAVRGLSFDGASAARPAPQVTDALASPRLRAVIICPSNPYLSIDPVLAVPRLRAQLSACAAPVIAVSPLIGGRAVKGPTAKIMRELGHEPTPRRIAEHYAGLIDGLVIDVADVEWARRCGVPTLVTPTLMTSLEDRVALARATLDFAATLRGGSGPDRPAPREDAHG